MAAVSHPRSVAVTGGSGFIGSAVVREALRQGCSATSLIRECEPRLELSGLRTRVVDWAEPTGLRELLAEASPDAIVHCAGSSARSSESASSIYEANVAITWRLLDAVAAACPRAQVVLLSSAAVYGPEPQVPTSETAVLDPRTHYAHSKVLAEGAARAFADVAGVRAVIARPFNVIGPGEPAGSVVERIGRQIIAADFDPEVRLREVVSVRDFVDVDDVARALLVLAAFGEAGTAYNICGGQGTSIRDLVSAGAAAWGRTARIVVEEPDASATVSLGDPALLRLLGWEPQVSLEQSMGRVLAVIAARAEEG